MEFEVMVNLHPRNLFRSTPLAIAVAALSGQAIAESPQKDEETSSSRMEMVVVTGYATGGLDSEITADAIEGMIALDMADMFRVDPVISAGGAVSAGQKIVVRNIGEDALNISIDGADQTNGVFHHSGRIALDPQLLKRVEIEAGPGSATAGPGALGGSVHFTTKDPSDLLTSDNQLGGLVRSSHFSNGDGGKLSATMLGQAGEVFSGMLSVGSSNRNTLKDGDGNDILGTASEQSLGFAKAVFDISSSQNLSMSYESIKEKGDLPYKTEWTIGSGANETDFSATKITRKTSTLNYAWLPADNDLVNFKMTAYTTKSLQQRGYGGDMGTGVGRTKSTGLNLQNTSQFASNTVIYGINYRDDKAIFADDYQEFNSESNQWIQYPSFSNESGGVTGLYIQDILTLMNESLTLSGGARYDEYDFTNNDGMTFDDSGVSLNLSANYIIADGLSVSAGYAEALRGVEASDPYKAISVRGYESGLQAESSSNTEFAIEYQRSGFTSALGFFSTIISDAIIASSPTADGNDGWVNPIGGPISVAPWGKIIANLDGDMETEGYSLDVGYQGAVAGISASYLSAETTVDGEKATRYLWAGKFNNVGDTLVLNAFWDVTQNVKLGWTIESVQKIDDIKQTQYVGGESLTVVKSGYTVHDFSINWSPLEDESLTLNLVLRNAFNEQYLSHAAVEDYSENAGWERLRGQYDVGRDIRLSLGYQF
ncbi:TonB-dependent receptor domain-containing protein [Marinagarivorans algicola]|uniref:TonB-dependent receptor domain-containing protein n=1 Tax=Marinagarivorans algicola TaxID=1513270 RepID=UPI0006B9EAFE|nr:TonB-dependent receptor [Marinagarivorans algicola]